MKKIFVLLMMALATCNISAKSNFVQVKDGHFVRNGKPYYYVGTNFWYGAILGSEGQGGLATCNISAKSNFVQVKDGHFVRNGKPYYYVGTNFWYGAILGSEGQGGNRERLCRELDKMKEMGIDNLRIGAILGSEGQGGNRERLCRELDKMKEMGIDNLRILVGSDGKRGVKTKVEPTLQEAPGVYNDTILAGLDYLLMEMGKRKMLAVLYLNNSWEWSGGYGYYLEQAGFGKAPLPSIDGYSAFMNFVAKYASCEKAHQLFYDYVKFILTRTNRYTKKKYKDDPAIMSWQIGNEPRAFSKEQLPAFEKWLGETSKLIRSLDKNHLISIGSEGKWGCEGELNCWERICADKNVDYCNIHLWPYNWSWARKDHLQEDLGISCKNTKEYIDEHLEVCGRIRKPLVMSWQIGNEPRAFSK